MAITNDFDKLRQAIVTLRKEARYRTLLRNMANKSGADIQAKIIAESQDPSTGFVGTSEPIGKYNPLTKTIEKVGETFPSIRRRGHRLADRETWQLGQTQVKINLGIEQDFYVDIKADSDDRVDYVTALLFGTDKKQYPIYPKPERRPRGRLVFWWGHPLKWPPKDGGDPGFRAFWRVIHPGITKPSNFVLRAIETFEPSLIDQIDVVLEKLVDPLVKFFR